MNVDIRLYRFQVKSDTHRIGWNSDFEIPDVQDSVWGDGYRLFDLDKYDLNCVH